MNETLKTLQERRSVRRYTNQQVEESALNASLEAGTWAPSGMGTQASVLVAVQDPETIALMSRLNAQIMGQSGTDPFYGAPTVVVVLADGENPNWLKDGSLVMGNLMNAAASLGVASCWINRATELFDLPEGQALLDKWGLPRTMRGVGNCILGYGKRCLKSGAMPRGGKRPGLRSNSRESKLWKAGFMIPKLPYVAAAPSWITGTSVPTAPLTATPTISVSGRRMSPGQRPCWPSCKEPTPAHQTQEKPGDPRRVSRFF